MILAWVCLCLHIDGLMQERRNSIANALELCLCCTNPSIFLMWYLWYWPSLITSLYSRFNREDWCRCWTWEESGGSVGVSDGRAQCVWMWQRHPWSSSRMVRHHRTQSTLVQVMTCHLLGTMPLPKQILNLLTIGSLWIKIHSFQMHLKMLFAKWTTFSSLNVLNSMPSHYMNQCWLIVNWISFSEMLIKTQKVYFMIMHLKIWSIKG